MPYYLYRVTQIGPIKQLAKISQYEAFKEASAAAKLLRAEIDPAQSRIQVVFGENELQAEDVINTVREPQPIYGEDV